MILDYRNVPARETQEGDMYLMRFDGMEHFISVASREREGYGQTARDRASRGSSYHDPTWYGTPNFDAAVKLARQGWPEGVEQTEKYLPELLTWFNEHTQKDSWVYDVEGEEVDVPRVLDGEPECWRQRKITSGKRRGKKYVHVAVNVVVNAGVPAATILKRSAVISSFVLALEAAGYRVQITAVESVKARSKATCGLIIPLKAYDDRLDPASLVFPLGHPSMLRRLVFGAQEMLPKSVRETFGFKHQGGYGSCYDGTADLCPDAHIRLALGNEITTESLLKAAAEAGFHFTKSEAA